jgi:hypothetical protein
MLLHVFYISSDNIPNIFVVATDAITKLPSTLSK